MICPRSRKATPTRIALALMILPACGDSESGRQFTQLSARNEGAVCLSATDGGEEFLVDVVSSRCFNSCERARGATCTAELDGERLVISSELTYTSETTACTSSSDECGRARVACGVVQLDASNIRIVHGVSDSGNLPAPTGALTQVFGWDPPLGACESPEVDVYFE